MDSFGHRLRTPKAFYNSSSQAAMQPSTLSTFYVKIPTLPERVKTIQDTLRDKKNLRNADVDELAKEVCVAPVFWRIHEQAPYVG